MFQLVRAETPLSEVTNNRHQWPVKFTATYTVDDTPAPVFVMQTASPDEFGEDEFSCVASAIQMIDLPVDAPSSEGPFFRVAEITVLARSALAGEEFAEKVINAVQNLADNIAASEALAVAETIVITPNT